MIYKNSDGTLTLALESDKLASLVEKVYSLFYENKGVFCDGTDDKLDACQQLFSDGHSLFVPGTLEVVTTTFRDIDDDYGIIPYPKFYENQNKYYTRIQDGVNLFCVPITCSNPDLAAAYLEATAAESYRTVTPAYYDTALKIKYSRDDVSGQMLDIIRDGVYMNFAIIYNESIGNPWFVLRTLMSNKSTNYASWEAQNKTAIEGKLNNLIKTMK